MIKAVIIDDEPNNIDNLNRLLKKYCHEVFIAATALNATDGENIIAEYKPELIFLDIQMPGKSGFDLLQSLPEHFFEIIFVTAFDKYGIQAVKFSAIDYLLKPINTDELQAAVNKAYIKIQQKKHNVQLENLIQFLQNQQQKEEHKIALPTLKETRFINPKQIIRCESSNNYTTFFLNTRETILVSKPIYEYDELLSDYSFIRCHQSHLVNKNFIRSFIKEDSGYLLLDDNTQIPVSRSKKQIITDALAKIRSQKK